MAGFTPTDRSIGGQARSTFRASTLGPFMIVAPEREFGGSVISAEPPMSPWRPDYLITTFDGRVWRIVSEDSRTSFEPFLLIARTDRVVTATEFVASSVGCPGCSSIWPGFITTVVQFYSYGRRLPGLQFRASPCG